MTPEVAKKLLIMLVKKYIIKDRAECLVEMINEHPDVPIRGVFEEIVSSGKKITPSDREILDDLMHFFG